MIDDAPLPDPDADSAPFWAGGARGELLLQACADCGRLRHPPRPMCPSCWSLATTWRQVAPQGRVWSYAVPHPPLLPAFTPYAPYNVCVVELVEDPSIRLVGNLVVTPDAPIDSVDPGTIEIDEPVRVVFERVADDVGLPRFVRDGAER